MAATAKTANGCGICISLSDEINKIYRALRVYLFPGCAISPKIKEKKEKHGWSKQTLNKKRSNGSSLLPSSERYDYSVKEAPNMHVKGQHGS
jgi:hypothetical protein